MKRLAITALCCVNSWGFTVFAQSSPVTTGGQISGSGGTVNYSIGQVFYDTNNTPGTKGTAAVGLQQPYTFSDITEDPNLSTAISIYPNPTPDVVVLEVGDMQLENMSFELYTIQGKLISKQNISEFKTNISMFNLAYGAYCTKL